MTSQIPGTRVPAALPPPPWRGFTAVWELGFREVYTVWLPRGRSPVHEVAIRHWQTWARWLGPAYGPAVVSILLLASGRDSYHSDQAWLLLLIGTINGGMFAAAVLSWKFALLKADHIDELLEPCGNRDSLVGVIAAALRHRWQAPPSILAALVPWIGFAGSGSRWLDTTGGIVVLLNCTWALMLLANVSYWLAVPPLLVLRLRSSREIRLRWNDPAHTTGIRTLSEGYAFPAVFLALAAFAVTVPGTLSHPLFGPFLPYLYLWLLILSLWVGIATQLSLYAIVRRFRISILDALAANRGLLLAENQSAALPSLIECDDQLSATLSIYGSVAASPGLPYGTALVVQYVAAVVGSVVGFLLQ
ncbi:hypothetical protein [Catenulispora subtropica]|uniref:Uncharacterized protein n=1 Tax=Catenulispora subtropica TaxID=450798 RepID=A0ABN2SZV3_9ACTN